MATIFGNRQILRTPTSSISVTLEDCDFNVDDANTLGYAKKANEGDSFSVDYNFFGTTIVTGGRYFQKKQFEWNLAVTREKAFELKALFDEQRILVQDFQQQLTSNTPTYADFYIELIDGRLADLEADSLSRSYDTATAMGLVLPSSTVTGYTFRWYRYLVYFQDIIGLDNVYMSNREIMSIQLTARELDLPTIANFPVTDLL